jgi:hypothetical protein
MDLPFAYLSITKNPILSHLNEKLSLKLDPSALVRALSKKCEQLFNGRENTAADIIATRGRYMIALINIRKNAVEAVSDANSLRNLGYDADSELFANVCPRAYRYASINFSPEMGFTNAVGRVNAFALKAAVKCMIENLSVNGIVGHAANPAIDCLAHCFMMGAFASVLSSALAQYPRYPQYPQYPWHPEFPWIPRYSHYPCIPLYPLVPISKHSIESKDSTESNESNESKEPQEPQDLQDLQQAHPPHTGFLDEFGWDEAYTLVFHYMASSPSDEADTLELMDCFFNTLIQK